MKSGSALLLLGLLLVTAAKQSEAQDRSTWPKTFRDWWQTPSQQAQRAWQEGDNERLQEVAPTETWRGAAAYRQGDFETANEAFSAPDAASAEPDSPQALRQQFNQATTEIQLGEYASAIEKLDTLLQQQPANEAAIRNRAIAKRLLELEQQLDEEQNNGEGSDPGEQSEGEENSDPNNSSDRSEQNAQRDAESDAQTESEQNSEQNGEPIGEPSDEQNQSASAQESSDASDAEPVSNEERDAEIEAARQALQNAETDEENADQAGENDSTTAAVESEPMSEQDQATEQWLRQIPDDPDDLLRRKLLQNHRSEYPDVQVNGRDY